MLGVFGLMGAEAFVYGFSFPYFALALRHRGLGPSAIGLNASLAGVGIVLLGPLVPRLLVHADLRKVLIAQFALSTVCFGVLLAVRSIAAWYAVRFVLGAVLASVWTTTEVRLNVAAADRQRGRILGASAALYAAFQFLGPVCLGAVGVQGRAPVIIATVPLAVAVVLAAVLREVEAPDTAGHARDMTFRTVLGRARPLMLAALTTGLMEASMQSLLPLFGVSLGLSTDSAARLVSASSAGEAIFAVVLGILADRFNANRLLNATLLIGTVSSSALLLVPAQSIALPCVLILAGGTLPGVYTLGVVLIGNRFAGPLLRTTTVGFTVCYSLGTVIGPVAVGALMGAFGSGALPVTTAATASVTMIVGMGQSRWFPW